MPEPDPEETGPAAFGDTAMIDLMTDVAREAGEIALSYFRNDPETWTKGADSPVTEADIAADRHIQGRLLSAYPQIGWLSEETTDNAERLQCEQVFIVDPIDGTRSFIAGGDDWTISLALVKDHRPVAAVLFRPVTDDIYVAAAGAGTRLNSRPLQVTDRDNLSGARIAGPKVLLENPPLARHGMVNAGYIRSLALRLARVADGSIDAAAARGRSRDWDLAAADLIVHEAGGRMSDTAGAPLRYNRAETRQPLLLAAAPNVHETLCSIVADMVDID